MDTLDDIGLHEAVEHEFGEVTQDIFTAQLRDGILK